MDGFKNTTKTQYSMGGACYAKGGSVKGAAKVAKVMGEFKSGELHSGSKKGPAVSNPKQAVAIALSEANKAKMPMMKAKGGSIEGSKADMAEDKALAKKVMKKDTGGAVARGNRMSAEEAGEDKVISRRRVTPAEPDYSKFKTYDAPSAPRADTPLQQRLQRRGPAGARYDDTPMLDRVVGAARNALGLKKGGAVKSYSATKAAAGKDIGKPGKQFSKIAANAAEEYGSEAAGKRVAGAVLNKLRHKAGGGLAVMPKSKKC